MRLAQLARKISVRPSEIVEFLAKRGIIIEENANSRVEDADAFSVIEAFAPGLLEADRAKLEQSSAKLSTPEVVASVQTDEIESPVDELIVESPVTEFVEELYVDQGEIAIEVPLESSSESLPEVIKAPKVELKGLSILGKIELPETRKKETTPVPETVVQEGVVESNTRDQRDRSRDRDRNRRKPTRTGNNPVAQERERQAHEAAQKKQREVEEEKERRKKYYANRVKPSVPSRSVRLFDEPLSTLSEEAPEKPKGLLRRFIHWLTTY